MTPGAEVRLTLDRAGRWQRYLDDLEAYAAVKQPLETVGTLARVTGSRR